MMRNRSIEFLYMLLISLYVYSLERIKIICLYILYVGLLVYMCYLK